ncbi:MAG: 16S rRNA (cytosine(1402)-N(4))-methyltransferase RsmH [Candidatus Parcubacteria bacterium]|nr:16S rRNA (cytosine(1402)-N(4))-methyltransferase RsmH [Candidatus Parcubacteria bacterium]
MKFIHEPVLSQEVLEYLAPKPNENFIDCTLGGGGHAQEILKLTAPNGKLLGIDLDPKAIKSVQENLNEFKDRLVLINDNYKNLKQIIYDSGFNQINGILFDLGLSSYELEDRARGFSFKGNDFLDMRFGSTGKTAADVISKYSEKDLLRVFKEYGEERFARQIASEIVRARKQNQILTANQLVLLLEKVYKNRPRPKKINLATKVFQALRIEVNDELNNLKSVLPQAVEILEKNGRLAVISFHSLEDRIVKEFFKREAKECICPPYVPICQCGHQKSLKILTKKPITPSLDEIKRNPRSRSAKLRVALKII